MARFATFLFGFLFFPLVFSPLTYKYMPDFYHHWHTDLIKYINYVVEKLP